MMIKIEYKLTLDRPATYRVEVPGEPGESWSDWMGGMVITVEHDAKGRRVTALTGAVDQAALHGLLRRLYAMGVPLLSVRCLDAA